MAIDLTGIDNVGEFFSQHYLDELLVGDLKELRKAWHEAPGRSPADRLRSCAQPFFRSLGDATKLRRPDALYAASHGIQVQIAEALGFDYAHHAFLALPNHRALPVIHRTDRHGEPYLVVLEGRFTREDEWALDVTPVTAQLAPGANVAGFTLAREPLGILIAETFALEAPPRWVVVISGANVFLAERARWGRGRHLRFDLDEILGRKDAKAINVCAALLSKDALAPSDGPPIHDTLDENSHKHAYGVSSDLKYAAREAVELLGNDWVHYQRTVAKKAMHTERVAQELTQECLRYLYRLLFIFYAEARYREFGSLPMSSVEYQLGYCLEALRDLEMVPLTTQEAQDGHFFHESLERLFALVNEGHPELQGVLEHGPEPDDGGYDERGFRIRGVQSPLFDPKATPRLSSIKFRNATLQQVIQLLSLSKERRRGKNAWGRGRISYAQLGINQLGSVYEGLLSYTGFFAKERLYEVHPAEQKTVDETEQAFFVPEREIDRYGEDELVFQDDEGEGQKHISAPGTFIFRLAGRDRERSASYYTPDVLTRCLVKYSLKELLDGGMDAGKAAAEGFRPKTADDILALTVCEPAMGSGAFLVEAIDQLADAYLERKQKELGETIPQESYQLEKQRVKSHIAAHNCYGVDLNPTAASLAEVSLWLATMHPGQATPWLGARLSAGNSLVGARLEAWDAADLETDDGLKKTLQGVVKKLGKKASFAAEVSRVLDAAAPGHADAVAELRALLAAHESSLRAIEDDAEAAEEVGGEAGLREQLLKDLKKALKALSTPRHHRKEPTRIEAEKVVRGEAPAESIYHFLLPDPGMSPFDGDKAIKDLAPDEVATLKAWRKKLSAKYSKTDRARLVRMSRRVDALYRRAFEDRQHALRLSRGFTPVWGQPEPEAPPSGWRSIGQRARLLQAARGPETAYGQLKRVMDLWAAQWAWPLAHVGQIPSRETWWQTVEATLDVQPRSFDEQLALIPDEPRRPDSDRPEAAWDVARVVASVVARVRPFHWELELPEVFVEGGGFDLIVGNPPWIKVQWNEQGILSDIDPRVVLDKLSASDTAKQRAAILGERTAEYLAAFEVDEGTKAFLNATSTYPLLTGVQTNLYKCFLTRSWGLGSSGGAVGLIHQDGLFDDPRGAALRTALYRRLRHAYRFRNELRLFPDAGNVLGFSFTVSGSAVRAEPGFWMGSGLFDPKTIYSHWTHDGAGAVPGIKTDDSRFEIRGHRSRLVCVGRDELSLFASLFDKPGTPALEARLPIVHSREVLAVLKKLATHPRRLRDLGDDVFGTVMFDETGAQRDETIRRETRVPEDASEWIVSGPHFHVGNPLYKTPREGCSTHRDYEPIDLETIPDDYLPRTNYVPACSNAEYLRRTP